MKSLARYLFCLPLLINTANAQLKESKLEKIINDDKNKVVNQLDDKDYLYKTKTLYFGQGLTLDGRFFTLGTIINHNVFEMEVDIEVRKMRFDFSKVKIFSNSLYNNTNNKEADTNVSVNVGTIRSLHRERFNVLGSLVELSGGLNLKYWIYKINKVVLDNVYESYDSLSHIHTYTIGESRYINKTFENQEFSMGPSMQFRISSGKEKGEAVFNVIGGVDLNFYFNSKFSIDLKFGVMLAPFSYK